MSNYGIPVYIILLAIVISLAGISYKLTELNEDKDNSPTELDKRNNQTIDYIINEKYVNVCRETYPMGFNHRIYNDKCIVTFWRSDAEKIIEMEMNNTNDK